MTFTVLCELIEQVFLINVSAIATHTCTLA